VEGISLPVSDDRLGVHLIRPVFDRRPIGPGAGRMRVAMWNGKRNKALGQRLVERGFATEEEVREAMWRLTITRMHDITQWRSGVFSYDEPEEMPQFPSRSEETCRNCFCLPKSVSTRESGLAPLPARKRST